METRDAAAILKMTGLLMELHQENEFKAKALANASFRLSKSNISTEGLSLAEIEQLEGMSKSIASKIYEIQSTGTLQEFHQLAEKTPSGLISMLKVKGLGPKKVGVIWRGLGIESLHELLYACNENRLVALDGFGLKTQEQILKAVEFTLMNNGYYHFAALALSAETILQAMQKANASLPCSLTGAIRRQAETLTHIELLLGLDESKHFNLPEEVFINAASAIREGDTLLLQSVSQVPVKIHLCAKENFTRLLFETTAHAKHLDKIKYVNSDTFFTDEQAIYHQLGLPYILPEMREGEQELDFIQKYRNEEIVTTQDLRGVLHNHSTYSDGLNNLREMAEACKAHGYNYFSICDHSQTAVYAGGLKPERVFEQHLEIDALNAELAPFKIFKGIESDILSDGSLDYTNEVLASFDMVVASIHSNLKMDEAKATARLLKAIENPYTTILGHPTGRLLLAREGYPIDHKRIIDACATNRVVIELNAHPYRLDLDWRWIHYAQERGVFISINPDAHSVNGLDMQFGLSAARKGGLLKSRCFNAFSLEEMNAYLQNKKSKI
jgi:DNA polymerase (family 10)